MRLNVINNGYIEAAQSDTLELDGATNTIAGVLSGAGEVAFANAGTTTIAANTKITVATFALYTRGTNITINGLVTDTGAYAQYDGTTLSLGATTLTLAGSALFQQGSGTPLVTGTGSLATKGTTTLVAGGTPLIVGGSATWLNSGTVVQNGYLQIGDSGSSSASVINASGATFLIDANNIRIANGSSSAKFINAGTLEMVTNAGTSYDDVNTSSTGTVLASQGTNLIFDAATDSFAGALTGSGQISFDAGSDTVAAGSTLTTNQFALYNNGTTLSLAGTDTISGALSVASNSTLSLAGSTTVSGFFSERDNSFVELGTNVLTLTGAAQFQQNSGSPDITGTGSLVTKGTTSLVGGGTALVIGNSATWSNTGTVFDTATDLQIGDSNGASAEVLNSTGGLFDLLSNGVTITNGSTPYSSFVNAGTLEMAANGGTAYVREVASSSGTVLVLQSDNLEFDGATTSLAGTIKGAGQVSFGGGTTTIAGSTTIGVNTLAVYNTSTALTFAGAETIAGNVTLEANSAVITLGGNATIDGSYTQYYGSTLLLGAYTLTVDGSATFVYGNAPTVTGNGTLATEGVTSLSGNSTALIVGGSAAWDNYGTVLDYQSFQVGNSSSAAASVVNEAGATFDLVAGVGINNGSTPVSSFTNAGLLEMTSFGGTSSLNEAFTNSGTVLAQGGRMNFLGPVSGTGTLEISAGGELGFNSAVASTQTVDFLDATGSMSLALTAPTSFGAEISGFVQGDTIDLTGIASTSVTETFSGGVLTFTNISSKAVVAALHFTNSPNFTFASDGNGGILIGDPQK